MKHVLMIFVFSVIGFTNLYAMAPDSRKSRLSEVVKKMRSLDTEDPSRSRTKVIDAAKTLKGQALKALKVLKGEKLPSDVKNSVNFLIQSLERGVNVLDSYSAWIEAIDNLLLSDWMSEVVVGADAAAMDEEVDLSEVVRDPVVAGSAAISPAGIVPGEKSI